jgi:hypothetical protein
LAIVQYEFVAFKEILQFLIGCKKDLRFKGIKDLIKEVFTDKTKEEEMSNGAKQTQKRDFWYMYGGVSSVGKIGVAFYEQSLKCALCHNDLKQPVSFLQTNGDYHIFDCIRRRHEIEGEPAAEKLEHNHVFHARCLRNFIEAEQERDKSKKGKLSEEDIHKLMRCVICYPQS